MNFNEFKTELIESILLIKSGIQKIVDPIAKSENITSSQFYVLFNIYEGNINTIGGLSKDLGVNQGNVSTLCKEMEKEGLITRIRNKDDERIVNITLTSKGEEKVKRLSNKIDELQNQFGNISKEKIKTIVTGIREFGNLLKDMERSDT